METESQEQVAEETKKLLSALSPDQTSLITVLQRVQKLFGYLPRRAMLEVACALGIHQTQVYSVASFYNQFRFIPPGKHPVKVCMGTACHIKGGDSILRVWETKLGIREGEVTADRMFSLDRVACVGCCAMAPVALVGEEVHGSMMPTRVDGILLAIRLSGGDGQPEGQPGGRGKENSEADSGLPQMTKDTDPK
ncbi:MAG: NAD(P)H-dependent oxidoreductase subunit E [bacterium]